MRFVHQILGVAAFVLAAKGTPCPCKTTSPPPAASVSVLHAFSNPSWAENLVVRPNGNLLVSRVDTPELWDVDPSTGDAVLVHAWNATEHKAALGIAETTPDVFYVAASALFDKNYDKTGGVNAVFRVDMRTFRRGVAGGDGNGNGNGNVRANATVRKLVDIPEAKLPNGLTTLDLDHVLVADSLNGVVYKVHTGTGAYAVAVDDPKMKPDYVNSTAAVKVGVNGIKVFNGHLYWSNTVAGFLARVPIDAGGHATGPSSIAVAPAAEADDFFIRDDGVTFVCQNQANTLSVAYLDPDASVPTHPIAGSNTATTVAGVSAAKFGRRPCDHTRLYLTTSGAMGKPINGTITVAGTVSYIETAQY
ncbi:Six-bladed beta-propeller, TolB-like protein [Niveomyces insectorum RCEF 264]|uniref:Six-bladed beta-propeller, TolB-like protein n=1 Tax=Niveomyces insectorum RCEF 264 TaxID=1081102 RepID=A0A167MTP0_9HYPO|nr:Six-bladed beta-propeller, TolB-like protein [Niveomyces insectorum RCEF 264]